MKKLFVSILTAAVSLAAVESAKADTLAKWTFETSPPADLTDNVAITGIAADVGTGTASGLHVSALTDWTTPVGNGSANSLSANNWAIGDYYQFSFATVGYQDIFASWSQTSSSTGPGEFKLAYQVNGGGFNDFLNYTVLPNQVALPGLGNWSSSLEIAGYKYSVDLSGVAALDNAASVDFRLIMLSNNDSTPPGTVAVAGSSRVDDFLATATAVPEPTAFALVTLGGVCFLALRRKR